MVEAVERAGVANMVWYNYRRVPALTLAKQMIEEGRLGRIFHSRFKFLQDWTMSADLPQGGAARGGSTPAFLEAASRATCLRTASMQRFGWLGRLPRCAARRRFSSASACMR